MDVRTCLSAAVLLLRKYTELGGSRSRMREKGAWTDGAVNCKKRFQYERKSPPWKGKIPEETDVLVTHTPPVSAVQRLLLSARTR